MIRLIRSALVGGFIGYNASNYLSHGIATVFVGMILLTLTVNHAIDWVSNNKF